MSIDRLNSGYSSESDRKLGTILNEIASKDIVGLTDIYDLLQVSQEDVNSKLAQYKNNDILSTIFRGEKLIIDSSLDMWSQRRDPALVYFIQKTWINRREDKIANSYRLACDTLVNIPLFDKSGVNVIYKRALTNAEKRKQASDKSHPSYWQFDILLNGMKYNYKSFFEDRPDSPYVQRLYQQYQAGFNKLIEIEPPNA